MQNSHVQCPLLRIFEKTKTLQILAVNESKTFFVQSLDSEKLL